MHSRKSTRDREAGDTLIEVLFTVVIMSIATAALMGALITSLSGSTEHRSLSVDDTLLKSVAEAAKSQIENESSANGTIFQACTSGSSPSYLITLPANYASSVGAYASSYTINGVTLPTGPSPTITISNTASFPNVIQTWSGSSATGSPTTCPASATSPGSGIQEITLTASAKNGFTQSLQFVVRQPNS